MALKECMVRKGEVATEAVATEATGGFDVSWEGFIYRRAPGVNRNRCFTPENF